eukprot:8994704-Ditylum_brightwellii.AAC.1
MGDRKGDDICFHTGTYEGKSGWLGSKFATAAGYIGVIVDKRSGSAKKATVSIWSCSKPHPDKPWTYAGALMM